jgi:hypothetical protein
MWVANPKQHPQPEEILRTHPDAAPLWDGLLRGALNGDDRTAGNTITTAAARVVENHSEVCASELRASRWGDR